MLKTNRFYDSEFILTPVPSEISYVYRESHKTHQARSIHVKLALLVQAFDWPNFVGRRLSQLSMVERFSLHLAFFICTRSVRRSQRHVEKELPL